MNNLLLLILLLLILVKLHAADNQFSPGCTATDYQFDLNILRLQPKNAGYKQSLYLLHNYTDKNIALFHMQNDDDTQSIYLNQTLAAGDWAVLSTNVSIKFICSIVNAKSRYGRIIPCEKTLQICEFSRVKYGMNNRGSFWLPNMATKSDAVKAIVKYGIIPGL